MAKLDNPHPWSPEYLITVFLEKEYGMRATEDLDYLIKRSVANDVRNALEGEWIDNGFTVDFGTHIEKHEDSIFVPTKAESDFHVPFLVPEVPDLTEYVGVSNYVNVSVSGTIVRINYTVSAVEMTVEKKSYQLYGDKNDVHVAEGLVHIEWSYDGDAAL